LAETAVVEVVFLTAFATCGNAAGAHRDGISGVDGVVFATNTVGALDVVGHKATVGCGVECLKAHDDAVVEAQDVIRQAFQLRYLLVGGIAALIALEVEDESPHARIPYLAEHASGIDVHSRSKRRIDVQAVVVSETAGPRGVLAFSLTGRQQEVRGKR